MLFLVETTVSSAQPRRPKIRRSEKRRKEKRADYVDDDERRKPVEGKLEHFSLFSLFPLRVESFLFLCSLNCLT